MAILSTLAAQVAAPKVRAARSVTPKAPTKEQQLKARILELRDHFTVVKANCLTLPDGKLLAIDFVRFSVKPREGLSADQIDDRKIPGTFEVRLKNGTSVNLNPETISIDLVNHTFTGTSVSRTSEGNLIDEDAFTFTHNPDFKVPAEAIAAYNEKKKAYNKEVKEGTYVPKARGKQVNPESARQKKLMAKQAGQANEAQVDQDLEG